MLVRGLWGLQIDPGKTHTFTANATFKITMATICKFEGDKRTSVHLSFQDKSFLLCSLIPEKIEQQVIDITCLKGETITLKIDGPNAVHLLGNYVSQKDEVDDEEDNDLYEIEDDVNGVVGMPYLEWGQNKYTRSSGQQSRVFDESDDFDDSDDSSENRPKYGHDDDDDSDEKGTSDDDDDSDEKETSDDDDDSDEKETSDDEDDDDDELIEKLTRRQLKPSRPKKTQATFDQAPAIQSIKQQQQQQQPISIESTPEIDKNVASPEPDRSYNDDLPSFVRIVVKDHKGKQTQKVKEEDITLSEQNSISLSAPLDHYTSKKAEVESMKRRSSPRLANKNISTPPSQTGTGKVPPTQEENTNIASTAKRRASPRLVVKTEDTLTSQGDIVDGTPPPVQEDAVRANPSVTKRSSQRINKNLNVLSSQESSAVDEPVQVEEAASVYSTRSSPRNLDKKKNVTSSQEMVTGEPTGSTIASKSTAVEPGADLGPVLSNLSDVENLLAEAMRNPSSKPGTILEDLDNMNEIFVKAIQTLKKDQSSPTVVDEKVTTLDEQMDKNALVVVEKGTPSTYAAGIVRRTSSRNANKHVNYALLPPNYLDSGFTGYDTEEQRETRNAPKTKNNKRKIKEQSSTDTINEAADTHVKTSVSQKESDKNKNTNVNKASSSETNITSNTENNNEDVDMSDIAEVRETTNDAVDKGISVAYKKTTVVIHANEDMDVSTDTPLTKSSDAATSTKPIPTKNNVHHHVKNERDDTMIDKINLTGAIKADIKSPKVTKKKNGNEHAKTTSEKTNTAKVVTSNEERNGGTLHESKNKSRDGKSTDQQPGKNQRPENTIIITDDDDSGVNSHNPNPPPLKPKKKKLLNLKQADTNIPPPSSSSSSTQKKKKKQATDPNKHSTHIPKAAHKSSDSRKLGNEGEEFNKKKKHKKRKRKDQDGKPNPKKLKSDVLRGQ